MKKYLNKEVCTPLGVLIFLALYVKEAMKSSAPIIDGVPQESFFPLIIFIFGSIAALILLVTAVKDTSKKEADENEKKEKFNPKTIYVVAAMMLFVLLFDTLGFMLTAPFLVFAMMLIYDDRPQNIPKKILFSVLITAAIYVLYTYVFEINFPEIWR